MLTYAKILNAEEFGSAYIPISRPADSHLTFVRYSLGSLTYRYKTKYMGKTSYLHYKVAAPYSLIVHEEIKRSQKSTTQSLLAKKRKNDAISDCQEELEKMTFLKKAKPGNIPLA